MKHLKCLPTLMLGASVMATGNPTWAQVSGMPAEQSAQQLDSPGVVPSIAAPLHDVHTIMLLICLAVFVLVFGIVLYSILKHRKSGGQGAASYHKSITAEIVWTVIPFLLVIAMVYPATTTLFAQKTAANTDTTRQSISR